VRAWGVRAWNGACMALHGCMGGAWVAHGSRWLCGACTHGVASPHVWACAHLPAAVWQVLAISMQHESDMQRTRVPPPP